MVVLIVWMWLEFRARQARLPTGTPRTWVAAVALARCALLWPSSASAQTWKQENRTRDGIVIYSRDVPGSPVKQVRAETVIDAAPALVWQALMDRDTFKGFAKHVKKDIIYKTDKASVWYHYQLYDYPLISKRDYTLRYESFEEPRAGSFRLVWSLANEHGPAPQKGVVRIRGAGGHVVLAPVGDGRRTSVVFWMHLDPGGSVPIWIANAANRSSLPDQLRALRESAVRRRDQRARR